MSTHPARARATRARAATCIVPVFCMLLAAPGATARTEPPAADFSDREEADDAGRLAESQAGHVSLGWSAGDGAFTYELQSAVDAAFADATPRYRGRDTMTFISGLEDGEHHFRVRARADASQRWGPWSDPIIVPVRHHSMALVWSLFGAGAVLFGSIVVFVAVNARRDDLDGVADG